VNLELPFDDAPGELDELVHGMDPHLDQGFLGDLRDAFDRLGASGAPASDEAVAA
jgi:hypothetical protein